MDANNKPEGFMIREKIHICATITALLLTCGFVRSQESPPQSSTDKVLTLQDCIEYALKHHSAVLSSEREVTASKAGVRQARSAYLPRLMANYNYSQSGYEGEQVGTGFRRVGTFTNEQTTLGLSETLYDGGRTHLAIRQAVAAQQVSLANLELARQERILAVVQAYFEVLRTKRLAEIASEAVVQAEKQIELIQARIDTGDAAKVDVFPAQVQLANAKLQKLQADNDARVAVNSLRNAMGMEKGPPLKLADVEEPTFTVPALDECLNLALKNRPEAMRAQAQVDAAKAALSYARAQTMPIPSASANYDRGLAGSGYDSQWSVGLGVTLNLFDGGALRAQVEAKRAQLESAMLSADQVRKDISAEVEEVHLNLTNAFERLKASKANVELAKTNLEVANTKYEQGLAIPLEIITAQVSYATAQAGYAQALYDCYIARARLDRAIGKRGW